jgi:hypothetical protein
MGLLYRMICFGTGVPSRGQDFSYNYCHALSADFLCKLSGSLSVLCTVLVSMPVQKLFPRHSVATHCIFRQHETGRIWWILTMVYNTQNYWVSGLCPLFRILNARKHNVLETGPVIEVTSFWGTQESMCLPPPHLRTETDPVSKMLCFLAFRIVDNGQTPETQ